MDEVLVRPATEADVERIGALWEHLVAYHRSLDQRMPVATTNGGHIYARRVAAQLHDAKMRILVAELDGVVIGFTLGVLVDLVPDMFEREIAGHLVDIFVEPPRRGQGVGRKLVNALVNWFCHQGARYIEWSVASQNTEGIAFWRAIGGCEVMTRMRLELAD